MADKTPVRVVFNSSNVATGMAEFQSGETVGVAFGGTGLTSIGSAGQIIKVNAAGNALEFGAEGDLSITNLVAPTNADLTLTTSGTGNIVLDSITIRGTTITSADSSIINIDEGVVIDGTLTTSTSLNIAGDGAIVTGIKDEDGMDSNSATKLATQQSIKAYVDSQVTAQDLDLAGDSGTGAVDLDSQSLTIAGGTGLASVAGSQTVTLNIDSTVATLTGSQTLTNKTLTTPIITEIDSGSTITLDATTDIVLDAGDGDVFFKDDGTTFGSATNTSGNLIIKSGTTTALTFSGANVTAAGNLTVDGNLDVTGTLDLSDSNFTNVGSLQLDSIAGDGDTNTSITFSGSDVITIATGGSGRLTIGDGALSPVTDNEIDLGTSSLEFKDAFFDGTVTTDALTVSATSTLADTNITGAATITNTSTDDSLLITSTEASNSAAPVITLKRNSGSPADADYLGRIKFKGENDADQELQYGSISGKILDASDGTEDGAIEFNVKKAGSNTIAVRINSDEVKLLNSTTLDVDGSGTFATDVSVGDDLTLVSDGAILSFGANSEIALTHVHDTGILLTDSGGTPTIQLHDANESVSSDGTNLIITSGGTAFKMPTSDGSAGQALITDGAGTLSFDTVATTTTSDTRAIVKNNKTVNTSARTVDYFQAAAFDMAWYFVALNDLTNDNTSGSVFTVCHNNSDAFISGPRGGSAGSTSAMPTTSADIASSQVRVKITGPSADGKISFYKIPISRESTSDATVGVTVTTSNTDVDSASESIDTFAHASFRAAKYVILIDDTAKTETGVTEALVVHDGTNAFVSQYGTVNTGNNDMITLSAAISGSNVVLSAAGLTPNLSLKIHKTLLADSMTAESNANQKIIAATTVSSTATAFDSFDLDDTTAAVYYVVGKNATEGTFSVQEVYLAGDIGEAGVSSGPFVSTKGTTQLEFTADFLDTTDNTVQMSVSSTSGGSTVVNAYRISCLAEE
jgi:hypothetical protein